MIKRIKRWWMLNIKKQSIIGVNWVKALESSYTRSRIVDREVARKEHSLNLVWSLVWANEPKNDYAAQ